MHKKIEYRLAFFPHCVTHEKDFKIQSIFACRLVGVGVCICVEEEEEQQRIV